MRFHVGDRALYIDNGAARYRVEKPFPCRDTDVMIRSRDVKMCTLDNDHIKGGGFRFQEIWLVAHIPSPVSLTTRISNHAVHSPAIINSRLDPQPLAIGPPSHHASFLQIVDKELLLLG